MDFVELEAIEGLRWSWNSWPVSKSESSALIIPLSIMCTPLMKFNELPILPYDPLICIQCGAVLNPYARVDYQSRIWICPFCYRKNPFRKSYLGINENNIPAELFPTYSTVEYHLGKKGLAQNSNSSSLLSKMNSFSGLDWAGNGVGGGPAFVFVVDDCTSNEELRVVKNELLHVISQLPENALVGLVVFDSMVRVYDLGFGECCRVVMFHGERDLSSEQVLHACYTKVLPSVEVENPQLVVWSESVAELLELNPKEFERPDFPLLFSGASPLVGAVPYAQNYGGHQFGMWAGQLGDGRAITLGEVLNSKSERWELQLKGAGKTPYSRFADGLAVLRSSIREFLCSEAMHSLGIPTTRALCLVMTGQDVTRDMFYDGNPKDEPGAIVCRVTQSFLRFGSYQLHASRGNEDLEVVRTLADYTIRHHFPHLENMSKSESISFSTGEEDDSTVDLTSNKYAAWAVEVAERTASMIARWQGVGFTHGVMNTDNMSVLGLTIDYGPFGFLDAFDPSYTPNTTDLPGRRYCFANQPDIGLWNVAQFATTLSTAKLLNEKEANYAMERYGIRFMDDYQAIMTKKLGLVKYNKQMIGDLLKHMAVDKVDYTNFFRLLSNIKADATIPDNQLLIPLKAALLDIGMERKEAWSSWVKSYIQELSTSGVSDDERKASMNSVNPKYILRNYLCQSAIDAAEQGDFGEVRRLLEVMQRPFDEQPGMEKYARLPPAWAYRPGVGMLSCSS